jgi:DNA-binding transcriptional regulator GbsR (MarR family)
MHELRDALVVDFGQQYVRFGHSELMGRVVGLLLTAATPLTEEDIAAELHVSKSPINQITSRLEQQNLIRRIRYKGDRRYFYEISGDVFFQAGLNLARLLEDNLHIAESHLHGALLRLKSAGGEERAEIRLLCERLIQMREYHRRISDAYRRAVEEWREASRALPDVETYMLELEAEPASL